MNFTLRKANKEDCTAMMKLVHELATYEKAPQEVTVTMDEFVDAGFGLKPIWEAFVAEIDHEIVGFALYYVRYSTWKGRSLYLEDFIVTEKLRGNKIGKALFERVIQEAKEKNYLSMVWQVLDWNEPALNFYQKYNSGLEKGWLNASLTKEQLYNFNI